jgi:hypothetical protein
MYKLWLNVLEDGTIKSSLYTSQKEEPDGYNFVVEEKKLIDSLREKLSNWYVRDGQLHRRFEVKLNITRSKEGLITANGTDYYIVAVEECGLDVVKIKYGALEVELPTDDVLHIKSTVPTKIAVYVDEQEYATLRTVYLEFI